MTLLVSCFLARVAFRVCFVDPRTECRILHGPWRHSGQSMNDAPILQKSWHENETDPSPAWLFKLRGGWWICASRIVEDGGSWDGCEVYASIEGDNLPQGKVYVPWDDRQGILPCWSQGACAAVLEVFQEFGKVAWRNESSYLQQIQSLEKQVLDGQKEKDQLLEEKVQQELVIHMLALEAAELHALSTCTNACMHACMVACACLLHTTQAQELRDKLVKEQDSHDCMFASRLHALAMQKHVLLLFDRIHVQV